MYRIITLDDPDAHKLRQRVPETTLPNPELQTQANCLYNILKANLGMMAGLAANQVDIPIRMLALPGWGVIVNPTFTPLNGEKRLGWEGCYSVPKLMAEVERWVNIKATGFSGFLGSPVTWNLFGAEAKTFQHELDHLNGILITDIAVAAQSQPEWDPKAIFRQPEREGN